MSLSTILKPNCPKCGKPAIEKSRSKIFKTTMIVLNCGHLIATGEMQASIDDIYEAIVSADGAKLRPYQIEGIKFGERANCKFILADEQGLGKMVQALCLMKLHPEKLLPAIVTCPTTIKPQWMYEAIRWLGIDSKFTMQIIQTSKDIAIPGFGLYIITYDILKKPEVFDMVDSIKSIFLDECQRIKDHLSGRAKAVQKIIKNKNIEHVIPMSGTPIKNHAGEYFTVLNLVDSITFNNYDKFIREDCDSYETNWGYKVGGLSNAERFREKTKNLIIRRTKADVLPDLPALDRKFHHVELDRRFNKAYANELDNLEETLYGEGSEFEKGSATIAIMSRLRHITGLSKITECLDFVTEFLLSCDRKIVIFTHHIDVMDLLYDKLKAWCADGGFIAPEKMHSGLDGDARAALAKRFKDTDCRIMIASTLAAGEGLNLQFCSDAVILERQWNPANEEQAEARFHRFGQENPVGITYMLASGTIDEYFTELVESKRAIVASALDGKEIQWDQQSLMKELAEILVAKGSKRWKI